MENQQESNIQDNLYFYPILHVNIGKFTLKVWTQPSIVKIAKNHEMDIDTQKMFVNFIYILGWTQQKMFVPEIVEINPFSRPIRLYEEIRKDANPVS